MSINIMAVTEKDWYQKGLQLKQKGHYQKAIHAFNQAIDNQIKFAQAYFERGICFYKLGNNRQATDDLAAAAGTIGYEILTSLGGRYTRRVIG